MRRFIACLLMLMALCSCSAREVTAVPLKTIPVATSEPQSTPAPSISSEPTPTVHPLRVNAMPVEKSVLQYTQFEAAMPEILLKETYTYRVEGEESRLFEYWQDNFDFLIMPGETLQFETTTYTYSEKKREAWDPNFMVLPSIVVDAFCKIGAANECVYERHAGGEDCDLFPSFPIVVLDESNRDIPSYCVHGETSPVLHNEYDRPLRIYVDLEQKEDRAVHEYTVEIALIPEETADYYRYADYFCCMLNRYKDFDGDGQDDQLAIGINYEGMNAHGILLHLSKGKFVFIDRNESTLFPDTIPWDYDEDGIYSLAIEDDLIYSSECEVIDLDHDIVESVLFVAAQPIEKRNEIYAEHMLVPDKTDGIFEKKCCESLSVNGVSYWEITEESDHPAVLRVYHDRWHEHDSEDIAAPAMEPYSDIDWNSEEKKFVIVNQGFAEPRNIRRK